MVPHVAERGRELFSITEKNRRVVLFRSGDGITTVSVWQRQDGRFCPVTLTDAELRDMARAVLSAIS